MSGAPAAVANDLANGLASDHSVGPWRLVNSLARAMMSVTSKPSRRPIRKTPTKAPYPPCISPCPLHESGSLSVTALATNVIGPGAYGTGAEKALRSPPKWTAALFGGPDGPLGWARQPPLEVNP